MNFNEFITQRLVILTERLNAIQQNAKKIEDLPLQSTLDPSSKILVSRGGIAESLEIDKIIKSLISGAYDKLLAIGIIEIVGNIAKIPAGARWKIADEYYSNTAEIDVTIAYCEAGNVRKVILVANKENNIVLIDGPQTAGAIVIRPNIPLDTVLVTEMDITDASIGEPITSVVINDLAKVYENGEMQIFRKPGTPPDETNKNPNIGDYCIGFVEDQFISADYLGGNTKLLTSYNI